MDKKCGSCRWYSEFPGECLDWVVSRGTTMHYKIVSAEDPACARYEAKEARNETE